MSYIYKPVDPSCVLYLDVDRSRRLDNKISDLSGKGNHGTVYGAIYKTGPVGQNVLSFDGIDDAADFGNGNSLNLALQKFSVVLWFQPLSLTNQIIISKGEAAKNGWYISLRSDYTIRLQVNNATTSEYVGSGSAIYTLGTWEQVIITWDPTLKTGRFYKNGIFKNKSTTTITLTESSLNLLVGAYTGMAYPTKVRIADLRIYNRLLTPSEVSQDFQNNRKFYGI